MNAYDYRVDYRWPRGSTRGRLFRLRANSWTQVDLLRRALLDIGATNFRVTRERWVAAHLELEKL